MASLEGFFVDYSKLDDVQKGFLGQDIGYRYVDSKMNAPMIVVGTAGSGKSLLAIHKARRIALRTSNYAIIVYTKSLKTYFKDGISAMNERDRDDAKKSGGIIDARKLCNPNKVYNYHEWKWLQNRNKAHYDFLIVDECQDFGEEEINEFVNSAGICFFFGDTDQTIMSFPDHYVQSTVSTSQQIGCREYKLRTNYRLTIETAEVVEKLLDTSIHGICVRHGEKPFLIDGDIDEQLDDFIEKKKNGVFSSSIAILMQYNTEFKAERGCNNSKASVEYVSNYLTRHGIENEYKYDNQSSLDFTTKNVKVITYWCAKGLQFKDVFVPACDRNLYGQNLRAQYVALSRASERLWIGYDNYLADKFPSEKSHLYRNPQ